MRFSIIIPAYNEAEAIAKTIASLKGQDVPRETFEIIVADNASTDMTSARAREAGADIVTREEQKGTNFARERGRKEAHGEIIVFLDADAEPPHDWLRHIEENLSRPGVVLTSGPYDYGFTGLQKWLNNLYVGVVFPLIPRILHFFFRKKTGVIMEGNFAGKREALESIGGLPPVAFWGDGSAIAKRVAGHAGNIFFDPTLTVKSSPRRFEAKGFFRLALRYAWAYLKMYMSHEFD